MDEWPRHGADEASESDTHVSKIASEINPNTATTSPISWTAVQPAGKVWRTNRAASLTLYLQDLLEVRWCEWWLSTGCRRPKASISGKVMTKEMWIVDASLHTTHSYYSAATTIPQRGPRGDYRLNVTRFLSLMVKQALDSSCSTWNQSSVWINVDWFTDSTSRCIFTWNPEGFKISEFSYFQWQIYLQ